MPPKLPRGEWPLAFDGHCEVCRVGRGCGGTGCGGGSEECGGMGGGTGVCQGPPEYPANTHTNDPTSKIQFRFASKSLSELLGLADHPARLPEPPVGNRRTQVTRHTSLEVVEHIFENTIRSPPATHLASLRVARGSGRGAEAGEWPAGGGEKHMWKSCSISRVQRDTGRCPTTTVRT